MCIYARDAHTYQWRHELIDISDVLISELRMQMHLYRMQHNKIMKLVTCDLQFYD